MLKFFTTLFYQPLYNGLVFLAAHVPFADAGIIIILFTVIVRLALFPLSQKSIKTQIKMREIGPELEAVKNKYKDDKKVQAEQVMLFYKEKGINPFSGFLYILIQFPIIIALYRIFYNGGIAHIDQALLYTFIHAPSQTSMLFLGVINLANKSIIFAALAAISQFFQARLIAPPVSAAKQGESMADNLARSMSFQTKYVLPVFIFFIGYALSAAISLYWIVSNLFSIGQELYVRRKLRK